MIVFIFLAVYFRPLHPQRVECSNSIMALLSLAILVVLGPRSMTPACNSRRVLLTTVLAITLQRVLMLHYSHLKTLSFLCDNLGFA